MAYAHMSYKKSEGWFLSALLSLAAGLLIVNLSFMGTRWIISGLLGLMLIISSVTVANAKHFFLTLYFLSLPIGATNFLGTLDDFHYGGAPGLYHTVYDFFLVLLLLAWVPELLIKKTSTIRLTHMDWAMGLIFVMAFLSMHNAASVRFSVYELVRLAVMYLTYLYIANLTDRESLKFIVVPLLLGLGLQCVVGFIQYATGGFLGLNLLGERTQTFMLGEVSRVGGTLGHPNEFARYLGFLIPLTLGLALAPLKTVYRLACGLLFLVASVVLVMTFSRAAWGGMLISLAIVAVLGVRARLISWRRAFVFSFIGFLSLACVALAFKDAIADRLFSYDSGSVASRVPQIEIALNIIKEHPIVGVGFNNYSEVMHLYDNTSERITSWFPMVVHNVYLLIAAEIGIPGLIFFLTFLYLFFKTGFRVLRRGDSLTKSLTVGIFAGVTAFLVQIMVMPPTLTSGSFLFFWIFAGLITALDHQQESVAGRISS